jgi:hypothetical protein
MALKVSGNLEKRPFFRMGGAAPGVAHVEVIIDDKSIDREHASRLLWMMTERPLELTARTSLRIYYVPTITALEMITGN